MPPALLDDFLLYFRYSPAIEVMVGKGVPEFVFQVQLTSSIEGSHRVRTC